LSEAIDGINYYLDEPTYETTYDGPLHDKIVQLRDDAEKLRILLDAPSPCQGHSEASLFEIIGSDTNTSDVKQNPEEQK